MVGTQRITRRLQVVDNPMVLESTFCRQKGSYTADEGMEGLNWHATWTEEHTSNGTRTIIMHSDERCYLLLTQSGHHSNTPSINSTEFLICS